MMFKAYNDLCNNLADKKPIENIPYPASAVYEPLIWILSKTIPLLYDIKYLSRI